MVKKASNTNSKPMSGFDREDFTRKGLKHIADLQASVLKARESLRNKTGALKEAQNEFYQGLADGCQLDLHFMKREDDDEDALSDEPEQLEAKA